MRAGAYTLPAEVAAEVATVFGLHGLPLPPKSPLTTPSGDDTPRLCKPDSGSSRTLDLDAVRRLCRRATERSSERVLTLDGLLPLRADFLVDANLTQDEFFSEKRRQASGRPRWKSLLQPKQLRELVSVAIHISHGSKPAKTHTIRIISIL